VIDRDDALRTRIHAALDGVYQPDPGLLRRAVEAAERRQRHAPRLRALLAAALAVVAAVLVVVLTLVQHQLSNGNHGPVRTPAPATRHLIYTLDAAGTVAALDPQTLRPVWHAAAGAPPSDSDPASLLRLSADGRTLWVLPLTDRRGGTTLRSFDAASGAPGASIPLSSQGNAAYHALAIDPSNGDLVAVGQDATRILVTVADPRRGVVLSTVATRTLPGAAPVSLDLSTEARFSADGSRLYYSYGGGDPDRSGVDWVTVQGATLTPCAPARPGAACIPGSGLGFALVGNDLLTLDNGAPQHLIELTAGGAPVRRLTTGLAAAGVTDPVLSGDGRTAILVGECAGLGGLARVDLAGGAAQALSTPGAAGGLPSAATPCGSRPHLLSDGTLVVARLDTAAANANSPAALQVIDPTTGRILRQTTTLAGIVDVVEGP